VEENGSKSCLSYDCRDHVLVRFCSVRICKEAAHMRPQEELPTVLDRGENLKKERQKHEADCRRQKNVTAFLCSCVLGLPKKVTRRVMGKWDAFPWINVSRGGCAQGSRYEGEGKGKK